MVVPPIGGPPHVQHRQSGTPPVRDPAQGANFPCDRAGEATRAAAKDFARALIAKQVADLQRSQVATAIFANPFTEPIEDTGIELGEIIAWRVWRVIEGVSEHMLASIWMHVLWYPGFVIDGDVRGMGNMGLSTSLPTGIYAFKERRSADVLAFQLSIGEGNFKAVVGRVALWGEVIEHVNGYRASHARVHSLEGINWTDDSGNREPGSKALLADLRARYHVEPKNERGV